MHRQGRVEFWAEAVPDPDGPITAVNECRANSALTPSSARTALWPCRYTFRTSCNATGTAGRRPAPRSPRSPAVTGCSIVISFLPAGAFRPNWHLLCMLPRPPTGAEGAGGQAGEGLPSVQALRPCAHSERDRGAETPGGPAGNRGRSRRVPAHASLSCVDSVPEPWFRQQLPDVNGHQCGAGVYRSWS